MTYLSTNVMNDMDRVFSRFFTNTNTNRGFATDIAETAEGYRIEADLPGFTPKDVEVRIEDNVLVIEAGAADGKDSPTADDENRTWFIRERIEGSRRRSFALPEDAGEDEDRHLLEGPQLGDAGISQDDIDKLFA